MVNLDSKTCFAINALNTRWYIRGLGGPGRQEAGHEPAVCACSPESHQYLGLHQQRGGSRERKGIVCSALYKALSGVLCLGQGSPAQEGSRVVGMSSEKGHKGNQGAGAPIL